MFDYLIGTVIDSESNTISLLTDFKIAFLINVIDNSFFKVNEVVKIYTHLFKGEENIALYGFNNKVDRFLFSELIKINGIGPKTAINILKKATSHGLITLIKNKDLNGLQKIGSIGAKADRIYYELKNKVVNLEGYNYKYPDVFDALINLGYKAQEIFPILNNLEGNLDSSSALKEVIVRLKDNEQWTFI